MSASASFPILDAIRTGNVARGYCSYAFIQAVHKLGLHQRATDSGSPADVSCSESPYRKYCCRIEPRGIYTGFLLMVIGCFHRSAGVRCPWRRWRPCACGRRPRHVC